MKNEKAITQLEQSLFHPSSLRPHPCFSDADAIFFGVAIGRIGRDDVADPAERAARADPEAGREDESQDARQDLPVVELADAWNKKTENACCNGIAHCLQVTSVLTLYVDAIRFVLKNSEQ